MISILAKVFWLLLAVAHALFLGKMGGRLEWAALSLGDAARVAGLGAAIVYFLAEAHGLGVARHFHVFGSWRRVVAFWSVVVLVHAAVPFRADLAETATADSAATSMVFVLPLTAVAMLLPLLRRSRPDGNAPTQLDLPRGTTIAAFAERFRTSRRLDRLRLPRERSFLERRLALAPPSAA